MFWLKCCPRCGGDLYEDSDMHGSFITCLQCSHYLTEVDDVILQDSRVTSEGYIPTLQS